MELVAYVDNGPSIAIWPGLATFMLMLACNLLRYGLLEALDLRQR